MGTYRPPATYRKYEPVKSFYYQTLWQKAMGRNGITYYIGQEVLVKADIYGSQFRKGKIYDLTEDGLVQVEKNSFNEYISIDNIMPAQ